MDASEDKTVKYIEPEKKQTKGNVKGPQQAKRRNKKDLSSEQPGLNTMDATMSKIAAMNATIRSLAVGTNSVPSSQGRNWHAMGAVNARPRAGEN